MTVEKKLVQEWAIEKATDTQLRAECARRGIVHGCTHGVSGRSWTCHCGATGEAGSPLETQEALCAHMLAEGCVLPEYGPHAQRLVSRKLSSDSIRAECERRHMRVFAEGTEPSDDALRTWCEVRGLISGDLAVVDLVRASDESIRSECERRHLIDPKLGERYELALTERIAIVRERDELRRKLDKAEGLVENFLAGEQITATDVQQLQRRAERAERERGASIAYTLRHEADRNPKPDNSIAHLPEDLLCEDA